jgi:hypothetical protein
MPFTTDSYDANESHAHLLGIRDGVRDSARSGLDVPQHMQLFNVHFTALDEAARQGGRLPRVVLEELERVADEAENLAKHLQVLGVVDGLFEGWEI